MSTPLDVKIGRRYFYKSGSVITKGELREVSLSSQGWRYNIGNNWYGVIAPTLEDLKVGLIRKYIFDRDQTLKELECKRSKTLRDHESNMTDLLELFRKMEAESE